MELFGVFWKCMYVLVRNDMEELNCYGVLGGS